jgi:segregation and condensation protein A
MYRVRLHTFEGPLDLLLFFIKRDELDIYDIPIAKITKEFLDYIHFMQELDL